jgi:uncharacterized protein YxjI
MNLYLKQKLFAIGDKYEFTDESQKIVFLAKKPALSLTKMYLNDANGKELYLIQKQLIALLPKYTVLKDGKEVLFVKKKFSLKPSFDITDGQGNAYKIQGDFFAFDFSMSMNDKYIGSVKKKLFSFGDAYELSIDDSFDPALFCCFALVIDNCLHNENKEHH